MNKITAAVISFLSICALISTGAIAQPSMQDGEDIEQVIRLFTQGIDTQDGASIRQSLHGEALVNAFNEDADGLISVGGSQFADLHESQRFGGQQRQITISDLSVFEGLQASASVDAFNEDVFYNYKLTLVKLDDRWSILHVMQRSRAAD